MKLKLVVFFMISIFWTGFSQESPVSEVPKVGLVLSGGGAKGFAHIGVLKVIEQTGIDLDYIAGTSMGAVVGGLYAANYSASEIDSIFNSFNFMELLQDKIPRAQSDFFTKQHGEKHLVSFPVTIRRKVTLPSAISSGQSVYNELNALFEHVNDIEDFSTLPTPFFCMTTDLETGKAVLLDSGHLPEVIRASASLPTLLEPLELNDKKYIDGGVANNFPVEEMLARGANIIIGVDVQGKLESNKDINSVIDVLNQIVNFQMYAGEKEKTEELTINIKPNTKDFSMTSFDKKIDIIAEGQRVAGEHRKELDAIASLQKKHLKEQKTFIKKPSKARKISKIRINKLKHFSAANIRGKMNLEVGDSLTYKELNYKIDRLSAGKDFDLIKYNFKEIEEDKFQLNLRLKEHDYIAYVKLGLHYDPLYQSSVLLNFSTKHMLIKNDVFSMDFIAGDNMRANLNYFVDNGIYTSYGINSRFNTLNASVEYDGGQVNKINKNYLDFTTLGYIQTTFNRKFALGVGLEHKFLEISTKSLVFEEEIENKFYFEKSNYLNALAYIKLDSYDRKAFPKHGFFLDSEFKYYISSTDYYENFSPFYQLKLKLAAVQTLYDKVSIHLTTEGGVTFDENTSEQFLFALGGYGENLINNHISFYGHDFEDYRNHSYLKGMLEVRYELYEKHTIGLIANYARTHLDIFNGIDVFENIISGYAFEYGYSSVIGPVKVVRDWSTDSATGKWYLSVGFWF